MHRAGAHPRHVGDDELGPRRSTATPSHRRQTPGNRFLLRFDDGAVVTPVQALTMSLVALEIAAFACRFASAVILPRAALVTELAPLSHMLMNGFFFSHGFDIELLLWRPCRGPGRSSQGKAMSRRLRTPRCRRQCFCSRGWSDQPRGGTIGPCGS